MEGGRQNSEYNILMMGDNIAKAEQNNKYAKEFLRIIRITYGLGHVSRFPEKINDYTAVSGHMRRLREGDSVLAQAVENFYSTLRGRLR